jgi:hypothetical protein
MQLALSWGMALLFALAGTAAKAAPPPKTQIMVVGVAHFVARGDLHNSVYAGSPLSATRQAQIAAVVERLARFHPTKVLIEEPFGDPTYQAQYRAYLAGRFALPANEAYQFGFKLAARSGDQTIVPIDTWGPSLYDDRTASGKRIDAYLRAHFYDIKDPHVP